MSDLAFNYSIRRSQRAKKTRIIVTSDKVEIVAPLRVSKSTIHAFVKSKQDWIIAAGDKIKEKKQNVKSLAPERYVDGASIPYLGEQIRIRLNPSLSEKVEIQFNKKVLSLFLSEKEFENQSSEFVRFTIINWMKKQAAEEVINYVNLHAKKQGLYPRSIRLKTQKSRWGSCGIHNDIHLNWLLILAPAKVMEYVVVHELCHIRERNHSAKFWDLVAIHFPDYKIHRDWLKQNGHSLMQGL